MHIVGALRREECSYQRVEGKREIFRAICVVTNWRMRTHAHKGLVLNFLRSCMELNGDLGGALYIFHILEARFCCTGY